MKLSFKVDILKALYVTVIILSNLLGAKITTIFGVDVSVGIFLVPIAFLVTDIMEEVLGKRDVQKLITITVIALIITFLFTAFSVWLPANARFTYASEYTTVFTNSLRMILASLVAFVLSQTNDVIAFEYFKKLTAGKYLWFRNNASTFISQFIDTTIFMFIAFYHLTPKFTFEYIWQLIIPYFIFKIIVALLDTPFCYLGVRWLKQSPDYEEKVKL
jgi:hypothetical protein